MGRSVTVALEFCHFDGVDSTFVTFVAQLPSASVLSLLKVVGRQQEHIKVELVDSKSNNVMNGIAFGQSSEARYIKTKQAFDIVYTVEENTRKRGEVQLLIEDIRTHEAESET